MFPLRIIYSLALVFLMLISTTCSTSEPNRAALTETFKRTIVPLDSLIKKEQEVDLGFEAFQMKAHDNHILVVHPEQKEIIAYDPQLAVKGQTYGKNKEQYFQSINSLSVDEMGIYIVDASFKSVVHLDYKDSITFFQHFSDFPLRSTRLYGFHYLFKGMNFQTREDYFKIIDFQKYRGNTINFPLKNQRDGGFAQDGMFTSNGTQFFYIGTWLGHLTSFDSLGNILYTSNTIDKTTQLPEIIYEANRQYLKSDSKPINIAVCASRKHLFVVSSFNDTEKPNANNNFIDVYDTSNGSYLYSFQIPLINNAQVQAIAINAKGLYICQGSLLSFWKFH